ncbi:hypothetical protein TM902_180060 [Tenacibaculum maritimum]|uniref:hypothetical protein n=1 Tax=Tenacibaculum maritimum TaxID=107401 RepID=UPI0012E44309|nr:hypothetical protein [Tenacibaculum maritimum]MCD9582302.1 hypothetical protein [Tenacibaculum maritimum]MCD9636684.1 hypothetical protein [Tenacibaculum maritimum]CAA0144787.1 hypothetical protein TM902_180060 [Tenacibaculum maritimum]CAA0192938.1 hypothetical protein USCSE301_250024 [Tenacibaculum maritimum]
MNRVLKAYKCVFPKFFIDAYNDYMWEDPKQFEVIFGKNQKEAVREKCINDECYSFFELKQHIKTRRFPESDLYSQEKSDLLIDLSEKQIKHLTHSLGVNVGSVCPDEFYRNYSAYHQKNEDCEKLVNLGLMENWKKFESEVYGVTEKGKEAVKTLLLTTNQNIN